MFYTLLLTTVLNQNIG